MELVLGRDPEPELAVSLPRPSTMNATRSRSSSRRVISSARAVSVAATNRRDTPHPRPGHRICRPPRSPTRPHCRAGTPPGQHCACLQGRFSRSASSPNMAAITCRPVPTGRGQQGLLRRLGDLGHRHDHLLRHRDLARQRVRLGTTARLLVGVAHGGPLYSSDDLAVADTYHLAGHGRGTATLKFYEGRDILHRPSTPPDRTSRTTDLATQCISFLQAAVQAW